MRTSLELLADRLQEHGAETFIRDRTSSNVRDARPVRRRLSVVEPLRLHVIDADDSSALQTITKPGNFVIRGGRPTQIVRMANASANLVCIPQALSIDTVLEMAEDCCAGADFVREHAFEIIGMATGGVGLQGMLDALSLLFDNPMLLADHNATVLAASNQSDGFDPLWEDWVALGYEEAVERWTGAAPSFSFEDVLAKLVVPQRRRSLSGESQYLLGGVRLGGEIGLCLDLSESSHVLSPAEVSAFALACDLVGELLEGHLSLGISTGADDPARSVSRLIDGATVASLAESEHIRLGRMMASPRVLALFSRLESGLEYAEQEVAAGRLRLHAADCCFVPRNEGIVGVLRAGDSMVDRVGTLVRDACGDGWEASVSFAFDDLEGMRLAYEQCLATHRLGKRLSPRPVVLEYRDVVCQDFHDSSAAMSDSRRFRDPKAFEMLEYDRSHGTALSETLYRYLRSYFITDVAAEALCIHRNTVFYRLDRIKELFGVDLKDVVALNSLELTFDILFARERANSGETDRNPSRVV